MVQRLEENSARGEIQSASDILEEDSSSSSSASSIVIVEKEDVEDGRENDEEIRSEGLGIATSSVSKDGFTVAKEKNELESLSAASRSELQSEQEMLVSKDTAGDEASPKLMDVEVLQPVPENDDEQPSQKSNSGLKQEQFDEDKISVNVNTNLSYSASQSHGAKILVPCNVHETSEGIIRDSDNSTQEIVPTVLLSAVEEVTEKKLDNSSDVKSDAPVLSTSVAAEIMDSRAQQSMYDEVNHRLQLIIVNQTFSLHLW